MLGARDVPGDAAQNRWSKYERDCTALDVGGGREEAAEGGGGRPRLPRGRTEAEGEGGWTALLARKTWLQSVSRPMKIGEYLKKIL